MEHALPRRTAGAPRSWSLLLTSENHGAVGPLGSTFPHAGEKHERVQVVEIVAAGTAPAPGTDLAGLVRFDFSDLDGENKQFGEVAGGAYFLAHEVEARCASAAPVAAQAGQVAPAEELARFCPACGSVGDVGPAYRDCCPDGNEARCIPKRLAEKCHELFRVALSTMRAAAPASPAQAAPLPASQPMIGKLLDQFSELPVLWGLNEPGALVRHGDVFKMLVAAGKAEQAQASTLGERQEGGAA